MTTNLYDSQDGIMLTDSRWSFEIGDNQYHYLVTCDTINFDKIATDGQFIFMFAGNMKEIAEWKNIIHNGIVVNLLQNKPNDLSVCMVSKYTKEVVYAFGIGYVFEHRYFLSGSGKSYTFPKIVDGCSINEAVNHAIMNDYYSGGNVKYYQLQNNNSNTTHTIFNLNDIVNEFESKGTVMKFEKLQNPQGVRFLNSTKVSECNEPIVQHTLNDMRFSANNISIRAPFEGGSWSSNEFEAFKKFLSKYYPE